MGLLSIFKRSSPPAEAPAPAAPTDAVAQARARARRRLIGATVLLGVGIVGFPLIFETQPRPVAVDIPFELPRKEGAALPDLHARPLTPAPGAVVADPVAPEASAPTEIVERASDQGREVVASSAAPAAPAAPVAPAVEASRPAEPRPAVDKASAARPVAKPASRPADAAHPAAGDKHPDKPARPAADAEAARARAALEGRTATSAAPAAGRIVVQVGAYSEPDKLREARHKVEQMGYKTYTQVVEHEGAKRTRVRVGPFATRAEADKVAARIKAAGLPAAILSL